METEKETFGQKGRVLFIFWITFILILCFLVFALFLVQFQISTSKKEIEEKGKMLAQVVAKIVETPVLYGDNVELERIVKEIIERKETTLDYLVIFNREGKPLTFTSKKPLKISPQKTLVISAPILEDLGKVEIGYSLIPLQKKIFFLLGVTLFFALLDSLLSALSIIFISRRLVIQPAEEIAKLNLQLKELTEELDKKVKERTKELEEERASLEIKVRARTKELRELAQSLDEKVKERTKELEERIKELEEFHRLTVGRELKMVELKEEIQRLKKENERLKEKLAKYEKIS